jgi:multiple sugar transport system substrate-binding protein
MKKLITMFAILLLSLSVFAGCSKDSASTTESGDWEKWEGKITVWDGPRWADDKENKYHWLEAKKAEFQDKYPGVEIEIVQTPWAEFNDKLSVAIAGRAWPDIAAVDISGAVNINHIKQGVIEEVGAFYTKDELKDFYPNALAAYDFDGKYYGVPNSMTVHAMLLNLDIFEAKGVEPPVDGRWTYDEFVEKMKALTGDGVYGFSTYLLPGYYEAWPFLLMDGGYPLNEDLTEYTFDSKEAISGLQKLVDLKFKHNVAPQEMGGADVGGTWNAWAAADQRTVAVQPWATWAVAAAQGEKFKTNFMVAEYPTGDTGEPVTIGGVGGWVMFKQEDANKKRMTAEFIKFISTADEQVEWAKNYGTFPSRQSAVDQNPFGDNPELAKAQELTTHAVAMPRHEKWARIDEAIQKELQLAANGEKTPEEALKDARKAVEGILGE